MAVGGDVLGVPAGSIIDELAVLRAKTLQTSLDDMIAVEVPNQGDHTASQGVNDKPYLHECAIQSGRFLEPPQTHCKCNAAGTSSNRLALYKQGMQTAQPGIRAFPTPNNM